MGSERRAVPPARETGGVRPPKAPKIQEPPLLKLPSPPPPPPLKPAARDSLPTEPAHIQPATPTPPTFEIYPRAEIPRERLKPQTPAPPREDLPRVAIIIDDIGYDRAMAEKFLELDLPLTLSLFPHSPFGEKILNAARARGTEIMLHLPMEPNEYPQVDPGEGALLATMSSDELTVRINAQLDALPAAKGVNNHMGSRLTANAGQMQQLFEVLRQRGLFFIDSRTTAQSAARQAAQLTGLPFAERDVFLDHEPKPEFIRQQIKKLIQNAERHGEAIGIAHPHEVTYRVLRELLPLLHKQVRLVPASQLARPVG